MSEDSHPQSDRQFYRVTFPELERPWIRINGQKYEVADVSERGIRFLHSADTVFPPGTEVQGTVLFHDGTSNTVEGNVLRTASRRNLRECIVQLEVGIPLAQITAQQRYLKKKFPGRR